MGPPLAAGRLAHRALTRPDPVFVVGTAGHIDHGKSTLVKALTGIDPDRLREEKERGMTIDLGFAWLRLPSGREVSIVDVPGHERFIKNMLAGVGGIDLALLVIASDEGLMPQTEEHLAILEILQIKRAVVALTKTDLVDQEWLELVEADVAERLGRSPISNVAIVPVSALTGAGLPALHETLDRALDDTPPKPDRGRPRVPIDRVFTMSGFGTVVTGTLIDGGIEVGQELEIQPAGLRTRARGIQTHKQKVERADPGARVAVNIAGVAVEQVERGQVLTVPGWLRPTTGLDARIQTRRGFPPLEHNAILSFHSGSAEASARVRLLNCDVVEPGQTAWAQIITANPVAVAKGDLFVLRGPNDTIGGGVVIEVRAKRHRRQSPDVLEKLEALDRGDVEEAVIQAIAGRLGNDLGGIAEKAGLTVSDAAKAVARLVADGRVYPIGDRFLSRRALDALSATVTDELGTYHRRFPLRNGMPREELRSRLRLATRESAALFGQLEANQVIVGEESVVRLLSHQARLTPDQEERVRRFVDELSSHPFAPPDLDALMAKHEIDAELLAALSARGMVAKVADSLAFSRDALNEIQRRVVERIQTAGSINVAELRDMLDTSRKYALALLEYFDQQRVTRRVGDSRVLR